MIKLNLSEAELEHIIEHLMECAQETLDRELMMKLWKAQRKAKQAELKGPRGQDL